MPVNFRPLTEQQKKMSDPAVKNAIRVLQVKGITLDQIKEAYAYYAQLAKRKALEDKS
jgi:hypothetical protein